MVGLLANGSGRWCEDSECPFHIEGGVVGLDCSEGHSGEGGRLEHVVMGSPLQPGLVGNESVGSCRLGVVPYTYSR